ncbi:paired box protein Pax-1-like [Ptychodera flava]|uniref:paired box protein Pax-1-like n=1 Tax=Ptychodera flava TaxID=63121 RepID=UPI00396A3702
MSIRSVAKQTDLPASTAANIINRFRQTGLTIQGRSSGRPHEKSRPEVVEYIEYLKSRKPSMTATEIRADLLHSGICDLNTLPAHRTIYDIFRRDLNFTYKKVSQVPKEQLTERNMQRIVQYIDMVSMMNPLTVHFFDEAGVKRTTGNRSYGHSRVGERAFEVQRYTSDVNLTLNLLHSPLGVSHFNIIHGPSNGMEMLHFFDEALQVIREDGNPAISPGDVVIMDNAGFHHGGIAEPE